MANGQKVADNTQHQSEESKVKAREVRDPEASVDSKVRQFKGKAALVVSAFAIAMTLFQIYTGAMKPWGAMQLRPLHLAFGGALIFILYPASKKLAQSKVALAVDLCLAALVVATNIYLFSQYHELPLRAGFPNQIDVTFAVITTILVVELARRVAGWTLPLMAVGFLIYAFTGPYWPGLLEHTTKTLARMTMVMYLTSDGIYGMALGVSSTFVYLFLLFAAILRVTGAGKFFTELAFSLVGHVKGGPAQVALLSSAFFGMISGSGVANAATTGSFTIPLMKNVGYPGYFAAAVEAVASTGGQIMPPMMGAAAFIMVEILGIPYGEIIVMAALPATLYFVSIGFMIYHRARHLGLEGLPREELPRTRDVLARGFHYIVPLIVLVVLLSVVRMSAMNSALWSMVSLLIVSMFRKESRISFGQLLNSFEEGARAALPIVGLTAVSGILIGVIAVTGLGLKFSQLMLTLSGGNMLLLLVLTMVGSIILGMGLPTTISYILLAMLVAPGLIELGVFPFAAHMFVFYFGVLALVTPPHCAAVFITSGIAGANMWKSAFAAVRLGLAAFVVAFVFIYDTKLLMVGGTGLEYLLIFITTMIGAFALSSAVEGLYVFDKKLNIIQRVLLLGASLLLILPGTTTDVPGIILLLLVLLWQYFQRRSDQKRVEVEAGV